MKAFFYRAALGLAAALSVSPLLADPPTTWHTGDSGNPLTLNSSALVATSIPSVPAPIPVGGDFNITVEGKKARVNIAKKESEVDINALMTLGKLLAGGGVTPDTVVTTAELSWKLLKDGAASADSDVMLVNVLPPGTHWSKVEGWSQKPAAYGATIVIRNNLAVEPAAIKYMVSAYYNGHYLHGITVVPVLVTSGMWNNQPRLDVRVEKIFNAGSGGNLVAAAIIRINYFIGGPLGKAVDRDDRYILYADGRIGPYYDSVAEEAAKKKAGEELNRLRNNAHEAGISTAFSGSPYLLMASPKYSGNGRVSWEIADYKYNAVEENFPSLSQIKADAYTGRWDWAPNVDPDMRYVVTIHRSSIPGSGKAITADSAKMSASEGVAQSKEAAVSSAYATAKARLAEERVLLSRVQAFIKSNPDAGTPLLAAYSNMMNRYNEELKATNILASAMTGRRDLTEQEKETVAHALPSEWTAMKATAASPWIGSGAPRESTEELMAKLKLEGNKLSLGNENISVSVGTTPGSLNNAISVRVGELTVKYVPDMPEGVLSEAQLLQCVDDLRKDIIDTTKPEFAATANDAGLLSVLPQGKSGSNFQGWSKYRHGEKRTLKDGSVIAYIIEGEYNGSYLRKVRVYADSQIYSGCVHDQNGVRGSLDCPLKSKVSVDIVYNHTPMNVGTADKPIGALLFMVQQGFRKFPATAESSTEYYMLRADGALMKQETPF
jgi:hypothetical protein